MNHEHHLIGDYTGRALNSQHGGRIVLSAACVVYLALPVRMCFLSRRHQP